MHWVFTQMDESQRICAFRHGCVGCRHTNRLHNPATNSGQVHPIEAGEKSPESAFPRNYLDNEETCVNFTVERWYPVANMSRYLSIRVYDYYSPGIYISLNFLLAYYD